MKINMPKSNSQSAADLIYNDGSIKHVVGSTGFRDMSPGISVKQGFSRDNYEYFREGETVARSLPDIIEQCDKAYHRVSLIRNIIDLMSDFAVKGIKLVHETSRGERFYQSWGEYIELTDRAERFLNLLFRQANVLVYSSCGEIERSSDLKKNLVNSSVKNIPLKYTFLNHRSVKIENEGLSTFSGVPIYSLELPSKLKNRLRNPKNDVDRETLKNLPNDIRVAIEQKTRILLSPSCFSVYFYKKDDWREWAIPFLYPLLDDVILLEKMKLADFSALDTAINKIRLWRLGSLEHRILPNANAINKLNNQLLAASGGGSVDVIWGPELDLIETKTDTAEFLGSKKYEPILNCIYQGLGVPPSLTGANTTGGFSNNYISLKTLVERLSYARSVLVSFLNKELRKIQLSMGYGSPALVEFDRMILTDETAEKAILLQLIDRNIIDRKTTLDRIGEKYDIVVARQQEESVMEATNEIPEKIGPFVTSNRENRKILLGQGIVTPSQVGVKLLPKQDGELSGMEFKKKHGVPGKTKGDPMQGRPRNSRDKQKRTRDDKIRRIQKPTM